MSVNVLDFIAGLSGGAAGVLAGHPLDTVKVRLQTTDMYRGTIHCIVSIGKKEGMSAFYKGISSPLYGLTFINAIVFGVYGNARRMFEDQDSIQSHLVSGGLAGLCQSVITSPVELTKTRVQLQQFSGNGNVKPGDLYKGPVDCFKKTYRKSGIRGLYRGLSVTIARDCPAIACYFASYDLMVRLLTDDGKPESLSLPGVLLAGGLAGVFSWLFNYPTDVVKTRFQADKEGKYANIRDCIRKTYKEGGARAFSKGLVSTCLRAFPSNAATFFAAEWTYRIYDEHFASKIKQEIGSLTVEEQYREKRPFNSAYYGVWSMWLKKNRHNEYAVSVLDMEDLSPHGSAVGGTGGGAPTATFTQFRPPQLSEEQLRIAKTDVGIGMYDYR